jgi:hypothetical protein
LVENANVLEISKYYDFFVKANQSGLLPKRKENKNNKI